MDLGPNPTLPKMDLDPHIRSVKVWLEVYTLGETSRLLKQEWIDHTLADSSLHSFKANFKAFIFLDADLVVTAEGLRSRGSGFTSSHLYILYLCIRRFSFANRLNNIIETLGDNWLNLSEELMKAVIMASIPAKCI